jgi:CheY-like chemotaxis protein
MSKSTIDVLMGVVEQLGHSGQHELSGPHRPIVDVDVSHVRRDLRLAKPSFLVVDDVPASCKLLSMLLRELGARGEKIFSAYTLRDAFEIIDYHAIDIVFCDLNLRHASGLQILKRLRTFPETTHLPFVLVTNSPDKRLLADAIEKGASAVLLKPLSIGAVVNELRSILSSRFVPDAAQW